MKKLLLVLLVLFVSTFTLMSCTRIQEPVKGALTKVKLKDLNAIPIEYGSLVSVTTHEAYPGWAQLWFEDEDRTIRIVLIEFTEQRRVHENVTVIPRN